MPNQFYEYLIRFNRFERERILRDTLELTIKDFQLRFNENRKNLKLNLPSINIELLRNDNFKGKVDNHMFFWGATKVYRNSYYIKSVVLVASGDGTPKSGFNILQALTVLIRIVNPQKDKDYISMILKKIGIIGETELMDKTVVIDNKKYSFSINNVFGVMFNISRK